MRKCSLKLQKFRQKNNKKISSTAIFAFNILHWRYSPLSCLHCSHSGFILPDFAICFVTSILEGKHLQDVIASFQSKIRTSVKEQLANA